MVKNNTSITKLRVFDFDDTIVRTDAKIKIITSNRKTIFLTPAEFSTHKKNPNYKYNFDDFNLVINPREVTKVTNILRNVISAPGNSREIVILSARDPESKSAIEDYLYQINIDPSKITLALLANPDPFKKSRWIENKIINGVTDVLFLDDSGKNIEAVKELKNKYPNIKLDARKVDYAMELDGEDS